MEKIFKDLEINIANNGREESKDLSVRTLDVNGETLQTSCNKRLSPAFSKTRFFFSSFSNTTLLG